MMYYRNQRKPGPIQFEIGAVLTPTALAEALQSLGIPSGYALARLIGVAPRTAQKWLTGQTPVPGPVAILVRLMLDNPAVFRAVKSAAPV